MRILSDTGIRQAEELGLIRWTQAPQEAQRQPMSVDVRFQEFYDLSTIDGDVLSPSTNSLPPRSQAIALATQGIALADGMVLSADLRSSLRRLGCYATTGVVMRLDERIAVEIGSHSNLGIELPPEERFAQLVFHFRKNEDACFWESGVSRDARARQGYETYEKLLSCDHGHEVTTRAELRAIIQEGHLGVEPFPVLQKQLLRVHAGKTARVLRAGTQVRFGDKSAKMEFETVDLPYRLRPGEHAIVDTRENLSLSQHVGLLFYDYLNGTGRGMGLWRSPGPQTGESLFCIPDGLIDPGYVGTFSRQPKTASLDGTLIEPDMPLGHAKAIFFPAGVSRAYGSAGLGSHYQGQKETVVVAK
jgi:deoxycytidine triphosphate deaminase